jgi:hypothetical protein
MTDDLPVRDGLESADSALGTANDKVQGLLSRAGGGRC